VLNMVGFKQENIANEEQTRFFTSNGIKKAGE
jgi:hypothetical protein